MTQTPDATRYRILLSLASGGSGSIARLSARSQASRQAITKHLEVLSGAGLVRSDRRDRERIWELEPRRLVAGGATAANQLPRSHRLPGLHRDASGDQLGGEAVTWIGANYEVLAKRRGSRSVPARSCLAVPSVCWQPQASHQVH